MQGTSACQVLEGRPLDKVGRVGVQLSIGKALIISMPYPLIVLIPLCPSAADPAMLHFAFVPSVSGSLGQG